MRRGVIRYGSCGSGLCGSDRGRERRALPSTTYVVPSALGDDLISLDPSTAGVERETEVRRATGNPR